MIYFMQIDGISDLVKIGYSQDPAYRARQLTWQVGKLVSVITTCAGRCTAEADIHRKFAQLRVNRQFCPHHIVGTEWFWLSDELQAFIDEVARTGELPLALNERRLDYVESLLQTGFRHAEIARRLGVSRQSVPGMISMLEWERRFHGRPKQGSQAA